MDNEVAMDSYPIACKDTPSVFFMKKNYLLHNKKVSKKMIYNTIK